MMDDKELKRGLIATFETLEILAKVSLDHINADKDVEKTLRGYLMASRLPNKTLEVLNQMDVLTD